MNAAAAVRQPDPAPGAPETAMSPTVSPVVAASSVTATSPESSSRMTGRATWLAALLMLPLMGAALWPWVLWLALAVDALLLLGWWHDARSLRRTGWRVQRPGGGRGRCGVPTEWPVTLVNPATDGGPLRFVLRQAGGADWSIDPEQRRKEAMVGPGELLRFSLSATPRRRGTVPPPLLEVTVDAPGRLAAARAVLADTPARVVYPPLAAFRQYDRLRTAGALRLLGVRRRRVVGSGREFERLREYQPDDSYRQINWKATARRNRPIVNVYQVERSQDVMLCVDTGRMMGRPVAGGTLLDAAVDAAMTLGHAAMREGDRVGLAVYGEQLDRYWSPKAGAAAMRGLSDALAACEATGAFPSPLALAEVLRARQRKRSLVFVWSDFGDPQLAEDLAAALRPVARHHVVVVLGVRDGVLSRLAKAHPEDRQMLYDVLAARHLEEERAARVGELRRLGIDVLEVEDVGQLSLMAVNRYLAVKARQRV